MVAARLRTENGMVASTGWWPRGAWAIVGIKLVEKQRDGGRKHTL